MIIQNHLLSDDERVIDLTRRMAPGRVHALKPTQIIIHYDVCDSLEMDDRAQLASGYHYHLAIQGGDADAKEVEVRQYVPFDRRGSAAKGFNHQEINIVIVNPGPLIRDATGHLRTVYNRSWEEDDAEEMQHIHKEAPASWQHWARYSYKERDALLDICGLLVEQYPTICDFSFLDLISGHDAP